MPSDPPAVAPSSPRSSKAAPLAGGRFEGVVGRPRPRPGDPRTPLARRLGTGPRQARGTGAVGLPSRTRKLLDESPSSSLRRASPCAATSFATLGRARRTGTGRVREAGRARGTRTTWSWALGQPSVYDERRGQAAPQLRGWRGRRDDRVVDEVADGRVEPARDVEARSAGPGSAPGIRCSRWPGRSGSTLPFVVVPKSSKFSMRIAVPSVHARRRRRSPPNRRRPRRCGGSRRPTITARR